jgi:dTDP-4-dehydrorhamnose reductase
MPPSPDELRPWSRRLPLLITGVTGVAGYAALRHFQSLFPGQVVGLRPPKTPMPGRDIVPVAAEDRRTLEELFRVWRFRSVLNAVGSCALKSCELDPAMAERLNVGSAEAVAAAARGARLVHLSSDLVFAGREAGGYREDDPPDPVTVYGRTMAIGESVVREAAPEAATLRISLPMGPSFNGHAGAIDWIDSRFRAGRPATLYYDEVRTPTYVDCLNRVFARLLTGDLAGLYHAGGPRRVTLHQIGQIVNRVGGYPAELLRGCLRHEAGPVPPRAGNVTMDGFRLSLALQEERPFLPWPAGEDLVPDGGDWHRRRPPGEPGGFGRIEERLYRPQPAAESR